MIEHDFVSPIIFAGVVLIAGCSGVLPGDDTTSPTPVEQPTPTAGQTPEVTPTPTPSGSEDHRQFAEALGKNLELFNPSNETWVSETAAHENGTISIHVERPEEWSFKRAEMEVVREAVRGMKLGTLPSKSAAKNSDEKVHRPEKVHIRVETEEGAPGTSITLESDLGTRYRQKQLSIEEFADQLANTRTSRVERDLGENETSYYLKIAEWRHLQDEQLYLLNNTELADTDGEYLQIDKTEIRPNQDEIYYEWSPEDLGQAYVRRGMITRTYWEAVRNVSSVQLVNQYPERLHSYADVEYGGDNDLELTVRTEYAFDFIEATGGDISDENILINGHYNLYYSKVNTTEVPSDE